MTVSNIMSSVSVQVVISPCCDRLKFLSDSLQQCKNLLLNDDYTLAVENLILEIVLLMKNGDQAGIVTVYDNAIDNILALRDTAFTDWMTSVKNTHTPIPKTVVEESF